MRTLITTLLAVAALTLTGCQSTGKLTSKPERPSPDLEKPETPKPQTGPVERPSPDLT
ncbi:hypothetical protein MXMO3_01723 [Maritalea myrionectae]|uniref:Uncharacterized protein n=1 Tax=Maritalea myrionectae TaxID=454601 RepID=A0A2R4MEF8_9HYPH|nr:hypothetical protein MXMO3_01723 [Maritalea myrionectae]